MEILAELATPRGVVVLRRAVATDLAGVVALLVDDPLGATRDAGPDLAPYERAFTAIDDDPAHLLVVGVRGDVVVATLQLTVLPGLARRGATRAQLEAVRVAASERGEGLGRAVVGWAVDEARRRGCDLVQLTSDKRRPDAHRFSASLGFTPSHEGFKLEL